MLLVSFQAQVACRMDVFEDENQLYCKQLTKLGADKVLRGRPRAAMFVVKFANLKSNLLSQNP